MKQTFSLILVLMGLGAFGQSGKVLEEIVAIVGENVILKTDLETEYIQAKSEMDFFEGDLKCAILNELIIQKLYLHKGQMDSVTVTAEQVNGEIDRRIAYYASQIGGEAKLEIYLGKSIEEYKEIMRPRVRDQLIIQQVQQQMIREITVTPTEIRNYYNKIPQDSLPVFEEEVEVAQIVIVPKANQYAREYAFETISKIRKDIESGKMSFEAAAKLHSQDYSSARNGGELGYFGRGQMVSEFERAVFKLKPDSISAIIETQFGYHIIKLIDRKGEKINARHILIKPYIVEDDYNAVRSQLNDILAKIKTDSNGIEAALCKYAALYSSDDYTKDNCGYYTDPGTGAQQIPLEMLDPETVSVIRGMKPGTFSEPVLIEQYDGSRAYRILYLRRKVPKHKANLKDDYQKIQQMALEEAQDKAVKEWIETYKRTAFVWIDEKYRNCSELSDWKQVE